MKRLSFAALLLATPAVCVAQAVTQQNIERAVALYENLQIEAARPLLQQIISPSYQAPVTPEQKVTALKYLGASYASIGRPDSALTFFIAALDFDPFTDLEPAKFTSQEIGPFNQAKQAIFKVGARPILPRVIAPRTDTAAFTFITTHRAQVTVELINQSDSTKREVLYEGQNEGLRSIPWTGVLRDGRFADSTTYELRVSGRSQLAAMGGASQTERQMFRVEHAYEPLEDTLPTLTANQLLPEQYPASAPWRDLGKGTWLAVAAVGLPLIALTHQDDLKGWTTHAVAAGGLGLGGAVFSFAYRRGNRDIPENVRENARRQRQRALFNTDVRERNQARIERTLLVITAR